MQKSVNLFCKKVQKSVNLFCKKNSDPEILNGLHL